MNGLQIFQYKQEEVHGVQINAEPWLVATDVCKILGIVNVSDALERLDDDEKLLSSLAISGQNRQTWLVNEPGVYNLIFTSRKLEAKEFKRHVTHVILPNIRLTGQYTDPSHHAQQSRKQQALQEAITLNVDEWNELKAVVDTVMHYRFPNAVQAAPFVKTECELEQFAETAYALLKRRCRLTGRAQRQSELSYNGGLTPATATKVFDLLVAQGRVERDVRLDQRGFNRNVVWYSVKE